SDIRIIAFPLAGFWSTGAGIPEIHTLSLHDALPISWGHHRGRVAGGRGAAPRPASWSPKRRGQASLAQAQAGPEGADQERESALGQGAGAAPLALSSCRRGGGGVVKQAGS